MKRRLETLYNVAIQIVEQKELDPLLSTIIKQARENTNADLGVIILIEPETGEIGEAFQSNYPMHKIPSGTQIIGKGVLGKILKGASIFSNDITKDTAFTSFPSWHPQIKALIGVPLKSSSGTTAILLIGNTAPEKNFTEDDFNFIKSISTLAAIAIESIRNIEKIKKEKAALKASEQKFRAIFDQTLQFIGLMTTDGTVMAANRSALALAGISESDVIGKPFWETPWWAHSKEMQDKLKAAIEEARAGKLVRFEATHPAADGTIRHVDFSLKPSKDETGKVVFLIPEGRDITDRTAIEEELRKNEQKYRELADLLPQVVFECNLDGKITFANRCAFETFGYSQEDFFRNLNIFDMIAPDDRWVAKENFSKIFSGNMPRSGEYKAIKKDGRIFPVIVNSTPIIQNNAIVGLRGVLSDIAEMKRTQENLQNSLEFQKLLLETAATAIYTVDKNNVITDINEAFSAITGISYADAIGKRCYEVFRDCPTETCELLLRERPKKVNGKLLSLKLPNERELSVLFNADTLVDDQGNILGAIRSFIDVTELIKAREAAIETSKMKSQFLANMSHEIRTPMNGIIGMTELLFSTNPNEEQKEYLSAVRDSAESLLTIINDILDFSKIEAGKMKVDNTDFDLRLLVESVQDIIAVNAAKKNLETIFFVHPDVPSRLLGDPGKIKQVLINLIGNAIKFTEKGEVIVNAEITKESGVMATLRFSVTDTGPGIPSDRIGTIFESFAQLDGSSTRKFGGTGLGLTISKQLVELMFGRIGVESTVGKGSCFWFELALRKQKEAPVFSLLPKALKDLKILIIDDNSTNRKVFTKMLELFGCRATAVGSGHLGINALKKSVHDKDPFIITFMDMQMPEMDGLETTAKIKADPDIAGTKIVVLTSMGFRGDLEKLEKLNCSGYLTKPIKQSMLFDMIITILHRGKPIDEEPEPVITKHMLEEKTKKDCKILLAEDHPINRKLIVSTLNKAGYHIESVENGRLALEQRKKCDWDLILMDIQMPEMDGFLATREIRRFEQEEKKTHTPIVALTAHAMTGDREKCMVAGMDEYLTKPINPQKLIKLVSKMAKSTKDIKLRKEGDNMTGNDSIPPVIGPLNLKDAMERFGNDLDFLIETLGEFTEMLTKQLDILSKAISEKRLDIIQSEAHKIKGAASNLSASNLADTAKELEFSAKNNDISAAPQIFARIKHESDNLRRFLTEMQNRG